MSVNSLLNLDESALGEWLSERGFPAYRGRQIRQWVFQGAPPTGTV